MTTYKVTADPMLRPVKAYTAPGELYAEGICVAVCDAPTLVIETSTGQKVHWRADLCKVDGDEMTERQLRAFRDKQPKVVVIDPEDREQVERLCKVLVESMHAAGDMASAAKGVHPATVTMALRKFANPTPPKPDEPMGLGAVVIEADGTVFTRVRRDSNHPWIDEEVRSSTWSDIDAVKVLSAGVTS